MVDVTIYGNCCPMCDGDVEELDAYDSDEGMPKAELKCLKCGYRFEIERLWVLSE